MIEAVKKRLESFGYILQNSDPYVLEFALEKVQSYIQNSCNITSIPGGLTAVVIDMTCGEFLSKKYAAGQLDLEALDFDQAVSSLSEGDTSVSFDTSSTPDQKIRQLITMLQSDGKESLVCYRKMRW